MKKIIITIIILVLFIFAVMFYNSNINNIKIDVENQNESIKLNVQDLKIELEGNNGEIVKLNEYKDKIIILNFWASWCSPCISELPDFNELNNEVDKDNVKVFMINLTDGIREKKENIISFVENENYSFDVLFDEGLKVADKLDVELYPTTFIFDKDGNLFKKIIGITNKDDLKEFIKEINK